MESTAKKLSVLIYFIRRDQRLSDNPVFHAISNTLSSQSQLTYLLPIYVFPAGQIEVSGFLDSNASPKPKSPYPEARSIIGRFWRCGPHRARFLAESVWDLKRSLEDAGSGLIIRVGTLVSVVKHAFEYLEGENVEVSAVWMTGGVVPEELQEENEVKKVVEEHGKQLHLLPDEKYFVNDGDLPFNNIKDLQDVFTTFRRSVEPLRSKPRTPLPKPPKLPPFPPTDLIPPQSSPFVIPSSYESVLDCLRKPIVPDPELTNPPSWPENKDALSAYPFKGGEQNARERLDDFLSKGLMSGYKGRRNGLLGTDFSTKLSSWLSQGCITARQVHAWLICFEDGNADAVPEAERSDMTLRLDRWKTVEGYGQGENESTISLRIELLWRDHMRLLARKYGSLLFSLDGPKGPFHGPPAEDGSTPQKSWRRIDISGLNADTTRNEFNRFRDGRTGMGIIDASMRELFLTGYTSGRARQIVVSFLAKYLKIDWRLGAEWYECMQIDYDGPSNWGNWQYLAGVGNDPREGRTLNPVKQALYYDSKGEYVKAWVPELRGIEVSVGPDGKGDEEALMGVFQAWRLDKNEKARLGLVGVDWTENPLVKVEFNVAKKPKRQPGQEPQRGRGQYRGRGRGGRRRGSGSGSGRGRGIGRGKEERQGDGEQLANGV